MFWSLEGDDFANKCNKGAYSLLKSAKKAMSDQIEYLNDQEAKRAEEEKYKECSESGIDAVIFLSQLKSLFEAANGKSHCAKRTQENFVRKAPGFSQITSAIQAASGDLEAARQTQISFLRNIESTIEGVPVLGHAKAAVHCALGQLEKCQEVALTATRTTLVAVAGVAGAVTGD